MVRADDVYHHTPTTRSRGAARAPRSPVTRWQGGSRTVHGHGELDGHGTIRERSTFSWAADGGMGSAAIPRNGQFYLYAPRNKSRGHSHRSGRLEPSDRPYQDAMANRWSPPVVQGGRATAIDGCSPDDDRTGCTYILEERVPGLRQVEPRTGSRIRAAFNARRTAPRTFGPDPAGRGFPPHHEEGPWIRKHGGEVLHRFSGQTHPEDI